MRKKYSILRVNTLLTSTNSWLLKIHSCAVPACRLSLFSYYLLMYRQTMRIPDLSSLISSTTTFCADTPIGTFPHPAKIHFRGLDASIRHHVPDRNKLIVNCIEQFIMFWCQKWTKHWSEICSGERTSVKTFCVSSKSLIKILEGGAFLSSICIVSKFIRQFLLGSY